MGIEGDYNGMIMDLLGPSLSDVFKYCKNRFTIKTTAMLADSMIDRLQSLHSKNFIHRDVKPENFMIGRLKHQSTVYAIDLGMAKRYIDPKTGNHIINK